MSLLKSQNNSDFLTIKNISHTFKLPIELIRFDIQVLFSNKFYQSRLSIHLDDEKELYNFKNHFKNYFDKEQLDYIIDDGEIYLANLLDECQNNKEKNFIIRKFKKAIDNGFFDNCLLHFDNPEVLNGSLMIPIDESDSLILKTQFPDLMYSKYGVKQTIWDQKTISFHKFNIIQECISKQCLLVFNYRINKIVKTRIYPSLIYHNVIDGLSYCIDCHHHIYRIDKMDNLKMDSNDIHHHSIYTSYYDYLWGNPTNDRKIYDIQLEIYNETSNIIPKIKFETKDRKYGKLTYQKKTNTYIYEDKIIGLKNFQRWLRGYGSSIIVIKPLELAKKMLDTAHNIKNMYDEI